MNGSTYRRCHCRDKDTGNPLGSKCQKLKTKRHGTYSLRQELPPREDGKRRSFARGGYGTKAEAQADLDHVRALLALPESDDAEGRARIADLLEQVAAEKGPLPDLEETRRRFATGQKLTSRLTVGDWLDMWLASKKTRRTTTSGYASHIRVHLKPRIGHYRLDRLNVGHLVEMFDGIADDNEVIAAENQARREQAARCRWGKRSRPPAEERARLAQERALLAAMKPFRKITGPATRQSVRRTLRAALNAAITQQLITFNPAAHVELESGKRPKALVWTDERVERWRRTGEKPSPVMVWTSDQLAAFLDAAVGDRLYAFFHLIGHRGLRRGEGVGQAWTDIDLDRGLLTVAKGIVVDNWEAYESDPKTDGSAATIALDDKTVEALRVHRARQNEERLVWGAAWKDTGKVFTQEDGSWLHPETVSNTFRRILATTDLPPISLRDLRHVAATLIHAGGGDIHTVKETLRHSQVSLTSDTYTSLFPEVDREVAEKAARLVSRARRTVPFRTAAHASLTQAAPDSTTPQPVETGQGIV
ncbi:tyrosine-type recombinase/integrase [Streptomyces sp. NRRL B-1677]|uniref:site-specific integrase n=1 Tax=Streptomyces sp. NRRL B-1677 TaxID=2682966 RepID=UPI001892A414|nr:tyrosine-type recombinase/integrase [Streptomyces sp. NRRL B-1677]MBF6048140.1 tyrosine-type recombinase/integrase [Streptomyces sp. NRRL B-1677]